MKGITLAFSFASNPR